MKRNKLLHKLFSTTLTLIMILSTVYMSFAASGSVQSAWQMHYGGGSSTWGFVVQGDLGTHTGTCMDANNHRIAVAGTGLTFSRLPQNSDLCKLAYVSRGMLSSDKGHYVVGRAASYLAGHTSYGNYIYTTDVNNLIYRAQHASTPPADFEAYIASPSNGGQDILFWREVPKGYAKVIKKVANDKSLTDLCPEHYTLAGAEYTIYSDSALTTSVGTLTTNAAGETNAVQVTPGTYYVKETKAPEGYIKDPQKYTVNVAANATATVESKDVPRFDPMDIVLYKKDASGNNLPLEGAEYTIKYYNKATDDVSGMTPLRTWVLRTNKKGQAFMRPEYLVSGDEFFKNEKGSVVGLIGTYSIEETKAPKGFIRTEDVTLCHIKSTGSDTGALTQYNVPTFNEEAVPIIKTTAVDKKDNDKTLRPKDKQVILDKVEYDRLIPGTTYRAVGWVMDKDTKKPLVIDGKEIKSEKTFTADKTKGSVDLEYPLVADKLDGKYVVIYTELYRDNKLLVEHKDINDKGETVRFAPPARMDFAFRQISRGLGVGTGDQTQMMFYVLIMVAAVGGIYVLFARKPKGGKENDEK